MTFTDISTAVNRQIVTASLKTRILKDAFNCDDINDKFNESKEIHLPSIKKYKEDLSSLKGLIKPLIKLFSKDIKTGVLFKKQIMQKQVMKKSKKWIIKEQTRITIKILKMKNPQIKRMI